MYTIKRSAIWRVWKCWKAPFRLPDRVNSVSFSFSKLSKLGQTLSAFRLLLFKENNVMTSCFLFSVVLSVQWQWLTTYPGLNLRADSWPPRTPRKTRTWLVPQLTLKSLYKKVLNFCLLLMLDYHLLNLIIYPDFLLWNVDCCFMKYFLLASYDEFGWIH